MAMRLSGLMSGMDTESIVTQLVEARKTKVTKAVKAQKSLGYKQEVWKSLNSQILKLYDGALSNMRFSSSYMKKVTKVSDSSIASVITGEGAMNSVQSLEVEKLAQSGYLTGRKMELVQGAKSTRLSGDVTLSEIGFDLPAGEKGTIKVKVGDGKETEISINRATTINDFVSQLRSAGVSANFDANNGRIYVAGSSTGVENDFNILGGNTNGWKALNCLGLNYEKTDEDIKKIRENDITNAIAKAIENLKKLAKESDPYFEARLRSEGIDLDELNKGHYNVEFMEKLTGVVGTVMKDANIDPELSNKLTLWQQNYTKSLQQIDDNIEQIKKENEALKADPDKNGAKKLPASDAKITLNGLEYTSSKNTFEINGLTITASSEGKATLTTEDDTDGIYDVVKNFFKEYNELINQMDKLYNAESASEYEPLTDEEKAEMSDNAVEEWEKKIKDSILRRDSSLNTIASAMKQIMSQGVEVNGKTMYLSNFGIETLSYFTAAENEKNAYHIAGDSDDSKTSGQADKLKSMIASDPDTVVAFFTKLSQNLYGKMTEVMGPTEYSSAYTAYDDKKMKTEYEDYKSKIKELEKKLADYEDQWYAKFAAMETAMAKMQSNASAVTSLLGG